MSTLKSFSSIWLTGSRIYYCFLSVSDNFSSHPLHCHPIKLHQSDNCSYLCISSNIFGGICNVSNILFLRNFLAKLVSKKVGIIGIIFWFDDFFTLKKVIIALRWDELKNSAWNLWKNAEIFESGMEMLPKYMKS